VNSEVEDETIRLITLLIVDFMAHGLLVECAMDNTILHHFWFSCNVDLLMSKEVGNVQGSKHHLVFQFLHDLV
jgi:hypothetical protein